MIEEGYVQQWELCEELASVELEKDAPEDELRGAGDGAKATRSLGGDIIVNCDFGDLFVLVDFGDIRPQDRTLKIVTFYFDNGERQSFVDSETNGAQFYLENGLSPARIDRAEGENGSQYRISFDGSSDSLTRIATLIESLSHATSVSVSVSKSLKAVSLDGTSDTLQMCGARLSDAVVSEGYIVPNRGSLSGDSIADPAPEGALSQIEDKAQIEAATIEEPRTLSLSNVASVQSYLNVLGYDAGVVDGLWGRNTERAISLFLGDRGLEWNGSLVQNKMDLLLAAVEDAGQFNLVSTEVLEENFCSAMDAGNEAYSALLLNKRGEARQFDSEGLLPAGTAYFLGFPSFLMLNQSIGYFLAAGVDEQTSQPNEKLPILFGAPSEVPDSLYGY